MGHNYTDKIGHITGSLGGARRVKLGQIQGELTRLDKGGGGVVIIFYLLSVKNITFFSFYAKRLKKAYFKNFTL